MNELATSTIKAEIIFGSPRRDCRGLGICKIVDSLSSSSLSFTGCPTSISARLSIGRLSQFNVFIKDGDIPPAVLSRYFGDGIFTIESTYHFTRELSAKLGFPNSRLMVPSGVYDFRETDRGISLHLKLLLYAVRAVSAQVLADEYLDQTG